MSSPSLSSNLLAAILARIEAEICRFEQQESPGLGESSPGFERRGLLEPHPPHPIIEMLCWSSNAFRPISP
jgi:hypothetical protein